MNRHRGLIFGVALLVALTPEVVRAECIPGGPWQKAPADRDSHLLFTGRVTRVGALTVSFDVDRVWSGKVPRHTTLLLMPGMEVRSPRSFTAGLSYFVDAHDSGVRAPFSDVDVAEGMPVYEIGFCSETGPLTEERVRENVRNLGQGRGPRS
jgi:hypothetical protein